MKSISEENESNVFEEYLKAYFCEHPEDAEGHFPKMHYIDEIGYYDRQHKGLSVLFNYGIESERLCTAYFKVYDHNDYTLAKRAARLHFKDSGMEYHRNPYEKQQWILNSKDIKRSGIYWKILTMMTTAPFCGSMICRRMRSGKCSIF